MTPSETIAASELMRKFAEGKCGVECCSRMLINEVWVYTLSPAWNWDNTWYREAPLAELRSAPSKDPIRESLTVALESVRDMLLSAIHGLHGSKPAIERLDQVQNALKSLQ